MLAQRINDWWDASKVARITEKRNRVYDEVKKEQEREDNQTENQLETKAGFNTYKGVSPAIR